MTSEALLSVKNLSVTVQGVPAVDGIGFEMAEAEVLGMVGESGSGKSLSAMAIMGLSKRQTVVEAESLQYRGRDLMRMTQAERAKWRGAEASMIFQDSRGALNPVRPVGHQIADVIARHDPARPTIIKARVLDILAEVRLSDPKAIFGAYPHELSGGQCQRIGIAAALASEPKLLIADEPTTGLDTITQAWIMGLIGELVRGRGMGLILITHDLALAAGHCDRIMVLHAGQVAEVAPVDQIFSAPKHPYTAGLVRSSPSLANDLDALQSLWGYPPDPSVMDLPKCRYAGRCDRRIAACDTPGPDLTVLNGAHILRCQNPL